MKYIIAAIIGLMCGRLHADILTLADDVKKTWKPGCSVNEQIDKDDVAWQQFVSAPNTQNYEVAARSCLETLLVLFDKYPDVVGWDCGEIGGGLQVGAVIAATEDNLLRILEFENQKITRSQLRKRYGDVIDKLRQK